MKKQNEEYLTEGQLVASALKGLKMMGKVAKMPFSLIANALRSVLGKGSTNTLSPERAGDLFAGSMKNATATAQKNGEIIMRLWYPDTSSIKTNDVTGIKVYTKWKSLPLFAIISRRHASSLFDSETKMFKSSQEQMKLNKIGIYVGAVSTKGDSDQAKKKVIPPSQYSSKVSPKIKEAIKAWGEMAEVYIANAKRVGNDDFKEMMKKKSENVSGSEGTKDAYYDTHTFGGINSVFNVLMGTTDEIYAPYKKEVDKWVSTIKSLITHLKQCDNSMNTRITRFSSLAKTEERKDAEVDSKEDNKKPQTDDPNATKQKDAKESAQTKTQTAKEPELAMAESLGEFITLLEKSEHEDTLDTDVENVRADTNPNAIKLDDTKKTIIEETYGYLKWMQLNFKWLNVYGQIGLSSTEFEIAKNSDVKSNNNNIYVGSLFNSFLGAPVLATAKTVNELNKKNADAFERKADEISRSSEDKSDALKSLEAMEDGEESTIKTDNGNLVFKKTGNSYELVSASIAQAGEYLGQKFTFKDEGGDLRIVGGFDNDLIDSDNLLVVKSDSDSEEDDEDTKKDPEDSTEGSEDDSKDSEDKEDSEDEDSKEDDSEEPEEGEEDESKVSVSELAEVLADDLADSKYNLPIKVKFDSEDRETKSRLDTIRTEPSVANIKAIAKAYDNESTNEETKKVYLNALVQLILIRYYYAYTLEANPEEKFREFAERIGDGLADTLKTPQSDDELDFICDALGVEKTEQMESAWAKNQDLLPKNGKFSDEFGETFFVESENYSFEGYLLLNKDDEPPLYSEDIK